MLDQVQDVGMQLADVTAAGPAIMLSDGRQGCTATTQDVKIGNVAATKALASNIVVSTQHCNCSRQDKAGRVSCGC